MSTVIKEILEIRKELEIFYVCTGECNEFKLNKFSNLSRELFKIESKFRQEYLNSKDSGLLVIDNEDGSLILKLKNANC
jgi:hypothetical protein